MSLRTFSGDGCGGIGPEGRHHDTGLRRRRLTAWDVSRDGTHSLAMADRDRGAATKVELCR